LPVQYENHLAFDIAVTEERIIKLQFTGECKFRKGKKKLSKDDICIDDEEYQQINESGVLEEISPNFDCSTSFLFEITSDMIRIHNLESTDFNNILVENAME
jgi:hypothetical protein